VDADAVEDDRTGKIVASDVYASNLKNTVEAFMKAAHADASTTPGPASRSFGRRPRSTRGTAGARWQPLTLMQ